MTHAYSHNKSVISSIGSVIPHKQHTKFMSSLHKVLLLLFFLLVSVFSIIEVVEEFQDMFHKEESIWHASFEIFFVISSLFALFYFSYIIYKQHQLRKTLETNLSRVNHKLERANIKLQEGKNNYLAVINWQFKEWKLSPSEIDIALLILKGLSIKEVAEGRTTHEKTVRKQASAIYEKSGLAGRHELSAWFFEDML